MPSTTRSLKECGWPFLWAIAVTVSTVSGQRVLTGDGDCGGGGRRGVGLPAQRPSSGDAPFTLAGSAACTACGTAKPASDSLSPSGPPRPVCQRDFRA